MNFRGTVTIVSADNPASALLGGFKQSASAFRYCRHCTGTSLDVQSKVYIWHLHVYRYCKSAAIWEVLNIYPSSLKKFKKMRGTCMRRRAYCKHLLLIDVQCTFTIICRGNTGDIA